MFGSLLGYPLIIILFGVQSYCVLASSSTTWTVLGLIMSSELLDYWLCLVIKMNNFFSFLLQFLFGLLYHVINECISCLSLSLLLMAFNTSYTSPSFVKKIYNIYFSVRSLLDKIIVVKVRFRYKRIGLYPYADDDLCDAKRPWDYSLS